MRALLHLPDWTCPRVVLVSLDNLRLLGLKGPKYTVKPIWRIYKENGWAMEWLQMAVSSGTMRPHKF